MSERDDGGPAFPKLHAMRPPEGNGSAHYYAHYSFDGMSLRDWFAGQALASILSSYQSTGVPMPRDTTDEIAADSYSIADAMLAERSKPTT